MGQQEELNRLLEHLEKKLDYTRKLITEYEEEMDYASQCNLQGFAQGIEFAIDEIKELVRQSEKHTATKERTSKNKAVSSSVRSFGKTKK